jgi:EAL domain-containing protein (putative c-di-GMP-specific phosphodiesterase class I)
VIGLAHGLGFSMIAEGVETDSQRGFLVRHGCNDFQGYFFGQPVPIHLFEASLLAVEGRSDGADARRLAPYTFK